MTAPGFEVNPEALDAFAKTSRGRADTFEDLLARVRDGEVDRKAFGIMPAAFSLYDRYEAFLADCMEGLKDGAAAMEAIAEAVDDTAQEYSTLDQETHNMFWN